MLTAYMEAAMRRAQYRWLEENGVFFGCVPELPGAWASGKTRAECEQMLGEVVDGWVVLGLRFGDEFPEIDGQTIHYRDVA